MAAAILRELFRPPGLDDFPGPFARRARQVAEELRGLLQGSALAGAQTFHHRRTHLGFYRARPRARHSREGGNPLP